MIAFLNFLRAKLQRKNKTTMELFIAYCDQTPWAPECRLYDV